MKIGALLREHAHFHHFLRTCHLLVTQLNFYSSMSGYEYGPDKKEFVNQCLDLCPGKGREHEHTLLNNMADFVRLSKYTVRITKPTKEYNEQRKETLKYQTKN